jgi:hypothetical protein
MGLDSLNRWFMELIIHKGYKATPEQLTAYQLPDMELISDVHDDIGCLLTRKSKIDYWRKRVQDEKEAGDITSMNFSVKILTKYIRGIYQ